MSARRLPLIGTALPLSLAAALVIAACGGDDGNGSSDEPAGFVERADAICEQQDNRIAAEMEVRFGEERQGPAPKGEELAFTTSTVIPGIQAQLDGLIELDVPAEDRQQYDEFLAALRDGLRRAEADPLELTIYGDRPRRDPVFADALRLADKIGFDDCTEGEPDIPD